MKETTKCRSCEADIFFIKYKGRPHPVNAKPKKVFIPVEVVGEETKWNFKFGYESHFSNCPQVNAWRKKNGK